MKRWAFGIIAVALLLALASLLWAQVTPQPSATAQAQAGQVCPPGTAAVVPGMAGAATQNSEFQRCSTTCNTVMPYYRQKYTTLRTHEGDAQCWDNCWNRFGNKTQTNVGVSDKKQLWQRMNAQYLRANQCAQTCYRKYHDEQQQAAITVAGFRSMPRPWVAAGTAPASPVAGLPAGTTGQAVAGATGTMGTAGATTSGTATASAGGGASAY